MPLTPAARRAVAILFLVCATFPEAARAQEARPLDASAVPMRGARPEAFAPAGWKIGMQVGGDLNGDGRADRVLHLVPRDDSAAAADILAPGPETQALVILLAARGGGWRRAGVAPRLLLPAMPQWGLQLAIRRGVLVVHQYYGMATVWNYTHRFRLHAPSGRFVLIGRDRLTYHRPQGMYDTEERSENYLTGVRLVTVGHLGRGGAYSERARRETIPRRRTAFEDVREWDDG